MSRDPLGNSKPLINREQNYVLDRKLLTVHSEDRDITKWPNSNTFEIMLPEQLLNVQSMRLVQATLPATFFTFMNDYQNTKFQFTVAGTSHIVAIQDGFYTPDQLALELTNKMNDIGAGFTVFFDEVKKTFWFGNTGSAFTLNFSDTDLKLRNASMSTLMPSWSAYDFISLPTALGVAITSSLVHSSSLL